MPKMKTRRGAAKRFSVTKTGVIRKNKANRTHLLKKKSPNRKRQLRRKNNVSLADKNRVRKMLGI
ncbi:MAG: 50S ribosomal protein L35 [Candidatus Neomarinimicrobiota bacterium]